MDDGEYRVQVLEDEVKHWKRLAERWRQAAWIRRQRANVLLQSNHVLLQLLYDPLPREFIPLTDEQVERIRQAVLDMDYRQPLDLTKGVAKLVDAWTDKQEASETSEKKNL